MTLSGLSQGSGNLRGGAEMLERVIRSYPESELAQNACFALARCYDSLGQRTRAAATLEVAVARAANDPMALNELAWNLATWKLDLARALVVATRAVELSKEDPGLLDTLAEVYFARGEFALAVATERKVIAKWPDDPSVADRLLKYESAARAAGSR